MRIKDFLWKIILKLAPKSLLRLFSKFGLNFMGDSSVGSLLRDDHPIPLDSIEAIDIMAVKGAGEVELLIVSSGYLDDSTRTAERMVDKITNYLHYIHSADFKEEFGEPSHDKTHIILSCTQKPHDVVIELIDKLQDHMYSNNASLSFKINTN